MYLEMFRLDGKTALITGGGRGIGLAAAHAFAEAGADVVISGQDEAVLATGLASLREAGYTARQVLLDVRDSAMTQRVADQLNQGDDKVDILFANAGIAWPDTAGEDMSDEVWDQVVDIDLKGVFRCCRSFGRHMLARGTGTIVTNGSMSGFISNRPQRQVHYNAAKAGVHHLTRSLAGEWASRGVRVNGVAPGYVDTDISGPALRMPELGGVWLPMTPMGRGGQPQEIAAVVLFLASEASSFLTGSIVVADGGYSIW